MGVRYLYNGKESSFHLMGKYDKLMKDSVAKCDEFQWAHDFKSDNKWVATPADSIALGDNYNHLFEMKKPGIWQYFGFDEIKTKQVDTLVEFHQSGDRQLGWLAILYNNKKDIDVVFALQIPTFLEFLVNSKGKSLKYKDCQELDGLVVIPKNGKYYDFSRCEHVEKIPLDEDLLDSPRMELIDRPKKGGKKK